MTGACLRIPPLVLGGSSPCTLCLAVARSIPSPPDPLCRAKWRVYNKRITGVDELRRFFQRRDFWDFVQGLTSLLSVVRYKTWLKKFSAQTWHDRRWFSESVELQRIWPSLILISAEPCHWDQNNCRQSYLLMCRLIFAMILLSPSLRVCRPH